MKSNAYLPSIIDNPPFLQENLDPSPFYELSKISAPINRGLHTINILYREVFSGIFCPNCEAVY